MGIYESFGTDDTAEKKGVWVTFGDGYEFLIARAGGKNKKFEKVLERKTRSIRRQLQTGTVADGKAEKLLIETYAQTVVMDWKNIADRDGKAMSFTVTNCIKLFTDLPEVFKFIREEADEMQNFQLEALEEDAKNSPTSSATS